MHLALAALFCLTACSSNPAFRRALGPGQEGYIIRDSADLKAVFNVAIILPGVNDQRTVDDHLLRAAGEECSARGFPYWDIGSLRTNSLRAFCYSANKKLSLGVMMDQKAAIAKKPELRIEDILVNSHTPLRPRDLVRRIGGKEVETIGDFKEQIFRLAAEGRKSVTVAVERSGIALSLEAPFSEQKEGVFTPEMLENLRNIAP